MSLGSVNRTTLREQVLAQLRDSILDGTLPPGTKMAEVDLAAQLGVSRGTVREALRTLAQGGLLQGEERTSLHVRVLTAREVRELFNVRAALEGQAAVDVMMSDDAAAAIDELERLLPEAPGGTTLGERFETDLAFHEALCRTSGNSMLLSMWTSVKDMMRMTIVALGDDTYLPMMSRSHHQPIIDALRSGDPTVVQQVIRDHMSAAAEVWTARGDS